MKIEQSQGLCNFLIRETCCEFVDLNEFVEAISQNSSTFITYNIMSISYCVGTLGRYVRAIIGTVRWGDLGQMGVTWDTPSNRECDGLVSNGPQYPSLQLAVPLSQVTPSYGNDTR